jgi:uroporphyrinogen-III synthase
MKLLVTRPAPDAGPLAELLTAAGHTVLVDPLLTIRFRDGTPVDLDDAAGLLFTSGNGVRAFAALSPRRDIPAYAVGDRTAVVAREEGFTRVESADGDVAALAALVERRCTPGDGVLVHVSGHDTAGDLAGRLEAAGHGVRRAVLYDADPSSDLSAATRTAIGGGTLDGVILFSPRTASHFAALVHLTGLSARTHRLTAWCLSQAVAEALHGLNLAAVHIAAEPTQAALLSLIAPGTAAASRQEDVLTEAPPPPPSDEVPPKKQPAKQRRVEPSIAAALPAEPGETPPAEILSPLPFEPSGTDPLDRPKSPPPPPAGPAKRRRSPLMIAGIVAVVAVGALTVAGPIIRDKLDGAGDVPSPHIVPPGTSTSAGGDAPAGTVPPSALTVSDGPTLHADGSTTDTPPPEVSAGPHVMMPAHEPAHGASPLNPPEPEPPASAPAADAPATVPPPEAPAATAAAPATQTATLAPTPSGDETPAAPPPAGPIPAASAPAPETEASAPVPAANDGAPMQGAGFTARLDADEARLDRLQQSSAPVQQGLASLGQRLAAIEAKPSADPASVQAVAADLQRVASNLNDAATRIARLEQQVQQQASAQRDEKEAVLAIAELKDRLAGSGPFDGPVGVLKSAAGSDPAMAAPLATLDKFATQGVASRAKLAIDLEALPAAINQPLPPAEDASLWQRVEARARRLFSVRRIDEDGTADKLPPGPDHSLAVAAATLKAGDLPGAIRAVQGLDGPAATVAQPWLAEATDRLAVEEAANRIGTVATQRLQGTGMPQQAPASATPASAPPSSATPASAPDKDPAQ